jgi:hypothetical protein
MYKPGAKLNCGSHLSRDIGRRSFSVIERLAFPTDEGITVACVLGVGQKQAAVGVDVVEI